MQPSEKPDPAFNAAVELAHLEGEIATAARKLRAAMQRCTDLGLRQRIFLVHAKAAELLHEVRSPR